MSLDLPMTDTGSGRASKRFAATLPVFAATIFLSAFLLFSVQPMFTKMVLPRLGGTPAIWSVAMVFFQGLLLAGYLYAHLSAKYLSTRTAAIVHLALLSATFALSLPIAVSDWLGRPSADHEAFWLLGVFGLSVGLPFFAVAGNGPLLQSWFSRSGHKHAADPYFLYGASNLGSFAALLMYPAIVEPLLTLRSQGLIWDAGFAMLGGGIALSAMCVLRQKPETSIASAAPTGASTPLTTHQRLSWICLALVPSGLLVAVTAHISTDIASAPFLWIVPLSLFLLTFVLVFKDRPLIPHALITKLWPAIAAVLCVCFYWLGSGVGFGLALHLGAFFVAAMMCHGELYRSRPAAAHLTEFYLWMSFGGVLGGLFASLVSPLVFNGIYEYPILIVLALACLPSAQPIRWRQTVIELACAAGVVMLFAIAWPLIKGDAGSGKGLAIAFVAAAGVAVIWLERKTPIRSAGAAAAMFVMLGLVADGGSTELSVRSFFGVNRLMRSDDGEYRDIVHGNTVHGTAHVRNADGSAISGRPEPLAYYAFGGGIDNAINATRAIHGGSLAHVAVAGLGAGSLACHVRPNEDWTFFEIDPSVIRLARDSRWFRFLSECAPQAKILTGDARLVMADQPATYDAIILDAFSSDSIPVHLLTEEAFAMYLGKLAPNGAIILNTSNRYLDVSGIVAALAERIGLHGALMPKDEAAKIVKSLPERSFPAEVVMLSRDPAVVTKVLSQPGWQPLHATGAAVWTDDFSNILGAMLRKK